MSEWKTVRLGDCCLKIGSGATPRGGSEVYLKSGIPFIRSQNVYNDHFDYSGLVYLSQEQARLLDGVKVLSGDILLNITGDSVARVNQVPHDVVPARVNQHVAIIRPDEEMLNARFVRYFLSTAQMQSHMLGLASSGATRNALTKGMIEDFKIPCPPILQQQAIARILGSIDDKIELNRRMNETLEALCQTLFKAWFVDFEPFGGVMPEDWKVERLGDVARNISRRFDFSWHDKVVFINTGDVLDGQFLHHDVSTSSTLPGQAKKAIQPNDILISEIRPGNGRYAFVDFDAHNYVISTKFMVIEPIVEMDTLYLYKTLTSQAYLEEFQRIAETRSGTFPQITFESIARCEILVPSQSYQRRFASATNPLYQKIKANIEENQTLAKLRDALLPRLLSGELRIQDVEAQL